MRDYLPAKDLLTARIILVTGAGDGIGPRRRWLTPGMAPILLGRTLAKLEKVYDEIERAGGAGRMNWMKLPFG